MLLAEGHPYGISVWDLSSGKSIGSADLGETVPRGVKFSPDGRLLAVGMDGAVRLWDVAAGRWIGGDLMHSGDSLMAHVAFSPDGKRIAWSGDHGAVGAWDWNLNPDKWVEPGCALAGRNMTPQEWNKHYPNKKYQKLCPQFP
jgi:WD40 repeat protein